MFRCSVSVALAYLLAMLAPQAFCGPPKPAAQPLLADLAGHEVHPLEEPGIRHNVFFFIRTDRPIANRYAPEIARLHAEFAGSGVAFRLVYPGTAETASSIARHLADYRLPRKALRDPHHLFAEKSQAKVTPEAAIFGANGALLYHGRIDDRYVDFGQSRPEATRHDFKEALGLALAGKPVAPPSAPAVNCLIEADE